MFVTASVIGITVTPNLGLFRMVTASLNIASISWRKSGIDISKENKPLADAKCCKWLPETDRVWPDLVPSPLTIALDDCGCLAVQSSSQLHLRMRMLSLSYEQSRRLRRDITSIINNALIRLPIVPTRLGSTQVRGDDAHTCYDMVCRYRTSFLIKCSLLASRHCSRLGFSLNV